MKSLLQLAITIVFGANIDALAQRRPLLFSNPSEPGTYPLADLKVQMREKFDTNHDGILNSEERNAMRLATKKAANARMEAFLAINDSGITDDDGDRSDWLELHNYGDKPINLHNAYLTDHRKGSPILARVFYYGDWSSVLSIP